GPGCLARRAAERPHSFFRNGLSPRPWHPEVSLEERREQQVQIVFHRGCLCIAAGMGLARVLRKKPDTRVHVESTGTLSQAQKGAYEHLGFTHYKHATRLEDAPRVIVQYESRWRLALAPVFDLVVLDETRSWTTSFASAPTRTCVCARTSSCCRAFF